MRVIPPGFESPPSDRGPKPETNNLLILFNMFKQKKISVKSITKKKLKIKTCPILSLPQRTMYGSDLTF